ncbi:MAG: cadherin domain-containing protein [Marinoscillum sp.]
MIDESKPLLLEDSGSEATAKFIAIKPHIIRNSDGYVEIDIHDIDFALKMVNIRYAPLGIQFYTLTPNFVDNDDYYYFDDQFEAALAEPNDLDNTINIYFVSSITRDGISFNGYAYFPGSFNRVFMTQSATVNSIAILSHELGHFFNLHHTHGTTNFGTTDELVDQSNCTTAGDFLCDTPADPNLTDLVEGDCEYVGTAKDANGDTYVPEVSNIMSYSLSRCRTSFSADQYNRMSEAYLSTRDYLDGYDVTSFASFVVIETNPYIGDAVQFVNQSFGALSWDWSFPGGVPSKSTSENPTVVYNSLGAFDVTLTIVDSNGESKSFTYEKYLEIDGPPDFKAFAGEWTSPIILSTVQGTNTDNTITVNDDLYVDYQFINTGGEFFGRIESRLYIDDNYRYYNGWTTTWINGYSKYYEDKLISNLSPGEHTIKIILDYEDMAEESNEDNNVFERIFTVYENVPVIDSLAISHAPCYGGVGSLVVYASGLKGPFNFSLDNEVFHTDSVFNNLDPGHYTIYVSDQEGNLSNQSISIGEPDSIKVSVDSSNEVVCDNLGAVYLSITGGSAPYQISLDSGKTYHDEDFFKELEAGQYQLTVLDANECTRTIEFTIDEILDETAPTMDLLDTAIVYLDEEGLATLSKAEINFGSFDDCSIEEELTWEISVNDFDCESATYNVVEVLLTDLVGNETSGNVVIQVLDTISPEILVENSTFFLHPDSVITIIPDHLDFISSDNCTLDSLWLSQSDFDSSHAGDNELILFASDKQGNIYQAEFLLSLVLKVDSTFRFDSVFVKDNSCFGETAGEIHIGAVFGTGPYTYSIDNVVFQPDSTFDNLLSDEYNVYVKDANDSLISRSIEIAEPEALVIESITLTHPNCEAINGEMSINVSGGTEPYFYSIDGSSYYENSDFDSLSAVDYDVIVKDINSCTSMTSATLINEGNFVAFDSIDWYMDSQGIGTIGLDDLFSNRPDQCGNNEIEWVIDDTHLNCSKDTNYVYVHGRILGTPIFYDSVFIELLDTISPILSLKPSATIRMNEFGNASVSFSQLNLDSFDNCGFEYELSENDFSVEGNYSISVTITDPSGNHASGSIDLEILPFEHFEGEASPVILEYFLDKDPGFGEGIILSLVDGVADFTLNLDGIASGIHVLYSRARDDKGKWSMTNRIPIIVTQQPAEIQLIEYSIDNDPGFGNGTQFSQTGIDGSMAFIIPLSGINAGVHVLKLRAMTTDGRWGHTQTSLFIKQDIQSEVEYVEYFIDNDPGFGQGILIEAQSGQIDMNISMDDLSNGLHRLYLRAGTQDNQWSHTTVYPFYRVKSNYNQSIHRIHYTISSDTHSEDFEYVVNEPSKEVDELIMLDVSTLIEGEMYEATFVAETVSGVLSQMESVQFTYESNVPPVLISKRFEIAENPQFNEVIGQVTASDDDNDELFYLLADSLMHLPVVVDSTGQIRVSDSAFYDYESNKHFAFLAIVSDGLEIDTATIFVDVLNINEKPVMVDQTFSILENRAHGHLIGQVMASDPDGDALKYKVIDGNQLGAIELNESTGQMTVLMSDVFDFERNPHLQFSVEVSDEEGLSTIANVLVSLEDVFENVAPVIVEDQVFEIEENSAFGTFVGTVLASDQDGNTLTYTISEGNLNDAFAIDASTGELTVLTSAVLDFETISQFDLTVQVDDGNGAVSSAIVQIKVIDVFENALPDIVNQTFTITENSPTDTSVGTITASDADDDPLTFSILSGNTDDAFAMNETTGELMVLTESALDFETTPVFNLAVEVNDGNGGIASATITINLEDVDESTNTAPSISNQSFTIAENSPSGTSVGTVQANDEDGDALTFSILSGNTGDAFAINETTGELTVLTQSALDFETNPSFELEIEVSDGVKNASAAIAINLSDLDDVTRLIPTVFNVPENSASGTVLGSIGFFSQNSDDFPYFEMSAGQFDENDPELVRGLELLNNAALVLSEENYDLVIDNSAVFDFEEIQSFKIQIGLCCYPIFETPKAVYQINVTNVNELTSISGQAFAIDENSTVGTLVGTVEAFDEDGDALNYSITSGNSNEAFEIGLSNGEITVSNSSALDFETITAFNLEVEVTDNNGASAAALITITLNDLDDEVVLGSQQIQKINVYPNPANDVIQVIIPANLIGEQLTIFDLTGKEIHSEVMLSTEQTLDLSNYAGGIYLIQVKDQSLRVSKNK